MQPGSAGILAGVFQIVTHRTYQEQLAGKMPALPGLRLQLIVEHREAVNRRRITAEDERAKCDR